jgi:hypothetical protein
MTLKKDFEEVLLAYETKEINISRAVNSLNETAENLVVNFTLWKENNALQDINGNYYGESRIGISRNNPINIYELLEIYKKDNKL